MAELEINSIYTEGDQATSELSKYNEFFHLPRLSHRHSPTRTKTKDENIVLYEHSTFSLANFRPLVCLENRCLYEQVTELAGQATLVEMSHQNVTVGHLRWSQ